MKYLFFTVVIIIVFVLSYNNVNLRLENVDHVRKHAELVSRALTAEAKYTNREQIFNNVLAKRLTVVNRKHEMEVNSKDIKIRKLIQVVVELYQMIQNKDRVT